MINLFRQLNLEDREFNLAQEARREYRLSHPENSQGEEDYVVQRVAEIIQREGIDEDVSDITESGEYCEFRSGNQLPLNGIHLRTVKKDSWQLAHDALNYPTLYGREMAKLILSDRGKNDDDAHEREQAKEALRYAS
jgi:hypothetical protein